MRKLITWSRNIRRQFRSTSKTNIENQGLDRTPGPESNTRAGVITTRPSRPVRTNAELPAPGTRKTRAVGRRRGIRQRRITLPPHFRNRRTDKYILPNRHGCRRLRVPKKQAPGNTKEARLRAVRHQRDGHRDLRHDPVDSKPTPTTTIPMAFYSGRRTQAYHRNGFPKPVWIVGGSTKQALNRPNHQPFRSTLQRVHQNDHRRYELPSALSRIPGHHASTCFRTRNDSTRCGTSHQDHARTSCF
jgi:hypothetical protein